jgi:hypothetical protein
VQKYWQLKLAHLFTWLASLDSLPAFFWTRYSPSCLVEVESLYEEHVLFVSSQIYY